MAKKKQGRRTKPAFAMVAAGLETSPEKVTIYGSHPAFGLLHQMHQSERRLFKADAENVVLREQYATLADKYNRLRAKIKKAGGKK